MRSRKKIKGISCILISIIFIGCQKGTNDATSNLPKIEATPIIQTTVIPQPPRLQQAAVTPQLTIQPQNTTTVAPTKVDWITVQKEAILRKKPEYKNYTIYSYPLENAYIFFYENPGADKEDYINYYGDIWVIGKDWMQQVQENAYVVPGKLEIGSMNGKSYFRYDISYVTASVTNLIMLDENEELHQISLLGALSNASENDITVIQSAYDSIYDKTDHYSCGHTWKPNYVYLENYGIKEYLVKDISQDDFLKFKGASDVLENLMNQYSQQGKTLHLMFMERENGMIHANISLESENDIRYYYETYQIKEDRSLEPVSHGEGTYGRLPADDE